MASIDRTAYLRFKRVVSARELAEAFTPTLDEIAWARGKTQGDEHCLALVVRLKSYQRLGYFPKLDEVPVVVIDYVRGLGEAVEAETDASRTAKRHRQFVREYLGVRYEAAKVRSITEKAIRQVLLADQDRGAGRGPGEIFGPVHEPEQVAPVEVVESVYLVADRHRTIQLIHDLASQLEARVRLRGPNVEEQVTGRGHRAMLGFDQFTERMQLRRARPAEQPVPGLRPNFDDATQPALRHPETERTLQTC